MRIIPVIDLRGGVVVHARRGERDRYAPLRSPLAPDPTDPAAVATALTRACGGPELYVADLDALAGGPVDVATLTRLSAVSAPWVDAGAVTPERHAEVTGAGAARVILGTESIGAEAPTGELPTEPPPVLSVDLRDGRLISPRPGLAGRPAAAAAPLARRLGVRELIVIDLARVGAGAGPPLDAVRALTRALPDVAVHAGGGVRDDADLAALERAGAAGALVASALHAGAITLPRSAPRGTPPPR